MLQGGGGDTDKPLPVQAIEALGYMADKFTTTLNAAAKLKGLGTPRIPARPGQGAPPPNGARPGGPAPQQAGGEAPKPNDAPPQPDNSTPEGIRNAYPLAAVETKIELMISALLLEVKDAPEPASALWLELLDSDDTPQIMLDTVYEKTGDIESFKYLIGTLIKKKSPDE
jgi:hypothetical protein